LSVFFEETKSNGVPLRYSQTPLSHIPIDELRLLVNDLNNLSDRLGCVVFEGDGSCETDLIIFAGNLERFSMLSVARSLGSRVFYFQDTLSWWYGGSELLPDIEGIAKFLLEHVVSRRCLAFGQSSGGYAALAIGALIPHCDVIACSPQTFPDKGMKGKFNISRELNVQSTPDYILDIAELYNRVDRTGAAAAIFSASEFGNPNTSHFWMDHLHLAHLTRARGVEIFVAGSNNHSIVFRRASLFADCLQRMLCCTGSNTATRMSIITHVVQAIQDVELPEE
jgi:hypothetical protein